MSELDESLRSRALALLGASVEEAERMPTEEVAKLLHELRIHQMELQIQNEELRQAQIQLAQSRDSYSDLYEFAPVGYLTLNRRGVIERANLTAATMLHVDRKHLVGRKFSEFVSHQSQDDWYGHRREVFTGAKTCACELSMNCRTSARVPATFRLQSLAFPDEQGRLTHCRMALADETERRIAVDALKKLNIDLDKSLLETTHHLDHSIEQLRLLSEAMGHLGEGVIITGDGLEWPGPKIVYVNETMCRMTGYKADELLGQTPRILQGEATNIDAVKQMRRDLAAGRSCIVELVNYRKDGTPYDVELFITPLCDAHGKHKNYVSIQRDITQRKRLSEALRREHDFNRSIVETSQNVTLVLDTDGRIVEFNPYLEKITGWRFDEVKGWCWFETFVPQQDRSTVQRMFREALVGKLAQGIIKPILTKDGQHRYIEWFNSPLNDSEGRLIGLLCTGQDVTLRRELEHHIVNIAKQERRRIGTDLHDSVGQELTGLSMVADSLVISLSRHSRPEVKIAETIKAGLQRTLSEVRKLSRGMNPVDIDAEGLMSSLSEMAAQLNGGPGLQCTFQCDQPVLLRDNETATQLFRIAQEATANAIRHAQPKRITISLERCEQRVVLRIRDDGCGIGANDTSTSGMGLRTMAYRAGTVQGELNVHAAEGGGTEVVCSVPARD